LRVESWSCGVPRLVSVPPNTEGPVDTVGVAGKVKQKVPDADDRG
jgi:hypothetical protein